MGCAASSPAPVEESKDEKSAVKVAAQPVAVSGDGDPVTQSAPSQTGGEGQDKSKKTRARRLSLIAAPDGGPPGAPPGAHPSPVSAPNPGSTKATGSARARRLSYISNDPNAGPMVVPPGAIEDPSGDEGYYDGPAAAPPHVTSQGKGLRLSTACMSRAGREPGFKKTNQDNCFAFEKYISEDQSLFGAMDGHGPNGHLVSGFIKQQLPIILVNQLTSKEDPRNALSTGFIEVDQALGNSRIDCEYSGSTCVVAYLNGNTMTTAWVGDSRGVMGSDTGDGNILAVDLTVDHKPTDPEERQRILASNGRVERLVDEDGEPVGPFRVWLQLAWIPGLAMSRALGDALAHQVGVSSEPQHTVTEIGPQDKFFILASDGIWEFITSQEAVDIIASVDSPEEGCRMLVDEAYQRWLSEEDGVVDDITAVVVKFLHD